MVTVLEMVLIDFSDGGSFGFHWDGEAVDIISDGEFWTLGVIEGTDRTGMVLMVLVACYSCWN